MQKLANKETLSINNPETMDYRGEVVACYKNRDPNNKKPPFELNGKGVAQIMILPYPRIIWREVDKLTDTERGVGGFGSTDKKS